MYMGIISRFKDIMSANINSLLDKCEDPAKMIDQYLRELESDLGKVKAETAAIMAEETRSKRVLDECNSEIAKMQDYAVKAIQAGNDDDARQFLFKKNQLLEKQSGLVQASALAASNAEKMKQMHNKLVQDMNSLTARKDTIKAKVAVAKTQEKINKMASSIDGVAGTMSAFDKMEDRANQMLDEANAMAELNLSQSKDNIADLTNKYDKVPTADVEDELAALKSSLGQ